MEYNIVVETPTPREVERKETLLAERKYSESYDTVIALQIPSNRNPCQDTFFIKDLIVAFTF